MFWLKSCPRCQGDLYQGIDLYETYISCLQCAHYIDKEDVIEVTTPPLVTADGPTSVGRAKPLAA